MTNDLQPAEQKRIGARAQRSRPAPEEPGAGGADQAVPVVVPHNRLLARSVLRGHTHTQLASITFPKQIALDSSIYAVTRRGCLEG